MPPSSFMRRKSPRLSRRPHSRSDDRASGALVPEAYVRSPAHCQPLSHYRLKQNESRRAIPAPRAGLSPSFSGLTPLVAAVHGPASKEIIELALTNQLAVANI